LAAGLLGPDENSAARASSSLSGSKDFLLPARPPPGGPALLPAPALLLLPSELLPNSAARAPDSAAPCLAAALVRARGLPAAEALGEDPAELCMQRNMSLWRVPSPPARWMGKV
jgi:hypothetical protein